MMKLLAWVRSAAAVLGTAACVMGAGVRAQTPDAAQAATVQAAPVQAAAGQGYTLSVTARVVVLDVVVTDKKGNPVKRADFTRDDFTIYEDAKPQRMRSFESPNAHQMPGGGAAAVVNSAADLKKIGDAPVTILVLDELNSRFEDMSYSRNSMVKYLESQPAVLREPTVLMVAMNTTFQQMHDYTQDRDALIAVVKKHMPEYPWRMMNSGKSGPGAVERMAQGLAALQQIAQASSGTAGRKNLIWVGVGFPSSDLQSLDDRTQAIILAAIRRVTNRMLAARITMYTINPAPGVSSTIDIQAPEDLDSSMDEAGNDPYDNGLASFTTFATATGGIAFRGRNDINNVIGEGIAQGSFYYSMSYSPSNASTDAAKYRNIRVQMKDPNLRAVTRDGYYPETQAEANPVLDPEMKPKQQKANLQLDLSGALTSAISYNGLDVRADKAADGTWHILVADKGLTWTPAADGADKAEATLAAGWYDAKGKLLGHVAQEEVSGRTAARTGAVFALTVPMPAHVARLRLVARDAASGRMGTFDVKF